MVANAAASLGVVGTAFTGWTVVSKKKDWKTVFAEWPATLKLVPLSLDEFIDCARRAVPRDRDRDVNSSSVGSHNRRNREIRRIKSHVIKTGI